MKSLLTLLTAILLLLLGAASLCAHERVGVAETASDSKEAVYQQLKLRIPGKVEAILLYREKQRMVVSLRLASYLLGTPEPQLPGIELWLLKPDGTVFSHLEKPKRIVSSHNGDAEPSLFYVFPNIEKTEPVALVLKVDGEFFVEKLASMDAHETNNIVTQISYTNNLSLEMSLPAKVRKGMPILLAVNLTNNSTNTIMHHVVNYVRELHLTLANSKHQAPAMTVQGSELLLHHQLSYHGAFLDPKATRSFPQIDLNKLFELPPEKYVVSATLEINGPTSPIHFSVSGEVEVME